MPSEELDAPLHAPRLKVLLVEDNPDDAALLERHLLRSGLSLEIECIDNAAGMHAALAGVKPDIIFGDYNLPNFSGPEALSILKSSGLDIPFIMLSGAVSEQTAVDSMRAGAQDYVSKQNLTRLVPAVERELKEARGRRNKLAAEVALRASEARFQNLVNAMPIGLVLSDVDGKILYANHAIARLLRRSTEELTSGDIGLGDICVDFRNAQAACSENAPAATPFASVCTASDGSRVDVLIGVAILNPGAPAALRQLATFIADLSLQKKSEEALRQTEKLAVAGRFAASIAHEINNPLEAITNCLYLTSLSELPDEARTFVDLAQKELDRVAQITMQTLRFFRGSTRQDTTDVRELMETVLTLLDSRLQRAQIKVVRDFHTDDTIVAQAGEIRQVIANLVGNGMDSMLSGGTLTLRTMHSHNFSTGADGVALTVADTGCGMNAETLARIFEPFFSTKGITGTGLGLWISQEIVAKHSGTLRVRSREGAGTVFRLFLPAVAKPSTATGSNTA